MQHSRVPGAIEDQFRTKLNRGVSCLTGTMQENLPTFLRDAAASLRNFALRAPDIANELRRFADDLEQQADLAERNTGPQRDDAAD
jgi:hypothetical protein